jgi:hypothetical protein
VEGYRQELPVARIHARHTGQKIAQAGFAVSAKAASAGRAVGRGGLVLGKAIAVIALPALFIGLIGANTRHRSDPPSLKIPTHNVRFDDAHLKALMDTNWSKYHTPAMPRFTFDAKGHVVPSGPTHEPVHPTTW